jgi:hypothetical protein
MPDTVLITLLSKSPLRSGPGVKSLLEAFENAPGCAPTHWGSDERSQNPYDKQTVLQAVGGFAEEYTTPVLVRRKTPKYEAFFSARDSGMKYVKVEFGSGLPDQEMRVAFTLADNLAKALEPEFGIVHPIWRLGALSQNYSASGIFKAPQFQNCGPRALCSRNWLGPHLAQLVGRDLLIATGCIVKDTPWKGLQVDLVERPEEATFEVLSDRQTEVMKRVMSTGVFGNYSNPRRCQHGPKWMPVPV